MQLDDLILVSVDDHVVEPPGMWDAHLPEQVPGRGAEARPQGRRHRRVGLQGPGAAQHRAQRRRRPAAGGVRHRPDVVRRDAARLLRHPRAGARHGRQRRARLAQLPVDARVLRPAVGEAPRQGRRPRAAAGLQRLAHRRVVRHATPAGSSRCALPALWDPTEMAAEMRRVAAKGCHAVTFSENPEKLGYPSLHTEHWDPFWQACSDEGTVVCLHIGSSSQLVVTAADAPINVMITLQPMNIVQAAADLLWSRVLQKFPDLRFALSRGRHRVDPVLPRAVDYVYKHHKAWTGTGPRRPAAVGAVQASGSSRCFIDDAVGRREPRTTSTSTRSRGSATTRTPTRRGRARPSCWRRRSRACPTTRSAKITHLNAMRDVRLRPVRARAARAGTVGALRARAADVDVRERAVTGAAPATRASRRSRSSRSPTPSRAVSASTGSHGVTGSHVPIGAARLSGLRERPATGGVGERASSGSTPPRATVFHAVTCSRCDAEDRAGRVGCEVPRVLRVVDVAEPSRAGHGRSRWRAMPSTVTTSNGLSRWTVTFAVGAEVSPVGRRTDTEQQLVVKPYAPHGTCRGSGGRSRSRASSTRRPRAARAPSSTRAPPVRSCPRTRPGRRVGSVTRASRG